MSNRKVRVEDCIDVGSLHSRGTNDGVDRHVCVEHMATKKSCWQATATELILPSAPIAACDIARDTLI